MNEARTTTIGIDEAIERRVEEIQSLVALGWTLEDAIRRVRETSTLGPKSWQRIMETLTNLGV